MNTNNDIFINKAVVAISRKFNMSISSLLKKTIRHFI